MQTTTAQDATTSSWVVRNRLFKSYWCRASRLWPSTKHSFTRQTMCPPIIWRPPTSVAASIISRQLRRLEQIPSWKMTRVQWVTRVSNSWREKLLSLIIHLNAHRTWWSKRSTWLLTRLTFHYRRSIQPTLFHKQGSRHRETYRGMEAQVKSSEAITTI